VDFADLAPSVAVDVTGCPTFTIEEALREAAIDFCERGHAYVHEMDEVPAEEELLLELPSRTRLVDVLYVTSDREPLDPIHRSDLRGFARGYTRISDRALRLHGVSGSTISVRLAVAPLPTATSIPDEIGYRWHRAFVAGAKHRLMIKPGLPWSNPALAEFYRNEFEVELNRAMLRASQDGVLAKRRVRMRSP